MNEDKILYMLLVSITGQACCASCPLLIKDMEIPQCAALQDVDLKFKNPEDAKVSRHPYCPLVKLKDEFVLKGGQDYEN